MPYISKSSAKPQLARKRFTAFFIVSMLAVPLSTNISAAPRWHDSNVPYGLAKKADRETTDTDSSDTTNTDTSASETTTDETATTTEETTDTTTTETATTTEEATDTTTETAPSTHELVWQAPMTREDGSSLYPGEIQGYRLHVTLEGESDTQVIPIEDGSSTTYVLEALAPGVYDVSISAVDTNNVESRRSASVQVNAG